MVKRIAGMKFNPADARITWHETFFTKPKKMNNDKYIQIE